jgi:hypothetical protein
MITKEQLKQFRSDFAVAVKDLEKKYNATIHLGSITYDDVSFHGKVQVDLLDASGKKVVDMDNFNLIKEVLGLKCDYGFQFKDEKNELWTVTNLNGRKPKYAVTITNRAGKNFGCTVSYVNMMVRMNETQALGKA